MVNALVKICGVQALSTKRALDSRNSLVRGLSRLIYRNKVPFANIHRNFFSLTLVELHSLLSVT